MRNKVGLLLLIALFFSVGGTLSVLLWSRSGVAVSAVQGTAEIPGSLENRVFQLSGEWEFLPGTMSTPGALPEGPAGFAALPGTWRNVPAEAFGETPGVATYHLALTGLKGLHEAAFWVPPVRSAGRLWVNGTEYPAPGNPSAEAASEQAASYSKIYTIPVSADGKMDIVIQVSSFHYYTGGIWEGSFLLGDPAHIRIRSLLVSAFSLFIVSALTVTGLLFLMLAAFNFRQEHLYFFLFSLAAIVRTLVSEQKLIVSLFSGRLWPYFLGAEYFSLLFGGVMLALFLWSRYKPNIKSGPLAAYGVLSLLLLGIYFLFPVEQRVFILPAFLGLSILLFGYIGFVLTRLFRKGETSAGLHLFGITLLLSFGLNDVLFLTGLINSVYLFSLGLLFFSFLTLLDHLLAIHRSNEVLSDLRDHLHTADRLKEHILSQTSHELRTPIHGIIGLSESLLRGAMGDLTEDQKSTLSLVFSSGLRLNAMVNDILDFSKIQEGGLSLRTGAVDLSLASDIVRKMCIPLIMGNEVQLYNDIQAHAVYIRGDENRIEQILYNLVGTAIKFSGSGEIHISAIANAEKTLVTVSVTASAIHDLPKKKVAQAFRAYAEDNLSLIDGFKIAGLSLAISRLLIELHGGELDYTCDDDGMGVFSFQLPYEIGDSSSETIEALDLSLDALENLESLEEGAEEDSAAKLKIMVVDDNPVNLQVIKNQLSGSIYRVMPFLSGEEALKHFEKNPPDLVLLDIMMPGMDGYEVCRQMRNRYTTTELPIILVTAKSDAMDMEEGLKAGANDFLAKPYTQEELLVRVKTHLNLSRTNSVYSRFVPIEFLEFLGHENIVDIQLGDQVQKEMTVLFVDIRAFTALSESMTPQENFKFINSFLSRLSPMIQENGGIIDKYIGDSIMALFPNRPEDAIRAAQEMVGHMELYNKQRATCGYRPISIGVGIHTGNLILGIIGDEGRMQGTVISDAVNLASRIQDVTKLYGANIIISQESFIKLENPTEYGFRFLGKVRVKGKNSTVSLFEIFDGDPEPMRSQKNETKSEFEEAILMFSKRDFDGASELFRKIIAVSHEDRASRLFLEKAETFIAQEKRRFLFTG